MADSFDSTLFKQSFQKVFEKDANGALKMTLNASFEVFSFLTKNKLVIQVKVGNGLKIEGLLGCCSSVQSKSAMVSDTEVGVGGTNQWKLCSLTPRNTFAIVYEIAGQVRQKMV